LLKVSRQPGGRPEIFYSLQGEGVNTGRPAVFLRLGLCNLACTWCDTRYTWDWSQYDPKEEMVEMSPEEVEEAIVAYGCNYLVVTGGEPMLQQRRLVPLLRRLKDRGFYIEIETNGTVVPVSGLVGVVDHWSVSPKLSSSGVLPLAREIPRGYAFFRRLPSTHFKYVVQDEDDVAEVQALVSRYGLPRDRIILMPEARDREGLLRRSEWLVGRCKSKSYVFSTRLQVLLWGGGRGV
jgi:organic radical activating enzyme